MMTEPELITRVAVYTFAAPLIITLVQGAKGMGLPVRIAPLLSLLLGVGTAFGATAAIPYPLQHWFVTLLIGAGLGLAASGLYSGTRATVQGQEPTGGGGQGGG